MIGQLPPLPAGANTFNPAIASKRKERDIMRLLMTNYKVQQNVDNPYEFTVDFHGPKDTPYEGGLWQVRVMLPDMYPYKSPSIGFVNKIFHPNIHEAYEPLFFNHFVPYMSFFLYCLGD